MSNNLEFYQIKGEVHLKENKDIDLRYVQHIIKNGSRYHVISLVGTNDGAFEVCSESNCEVNKPYHDYVSETNK